MMDILSSMGLVQWLSIGALVVFGVTGLGLLVLYHRERRRAAEAISELTGPDVAVVDRLPDEKRARAGDLDDAEYDDVSLEGGSDTDTLPDGGVAARALADEVRIDPPAIGGGIFSLLGEWRHRAKAKRLARKGYVKWYTFDSSLSRPVWVKPFRNGEGQLIYYRDGQPYWFGRDAMVTDARTGAFVALHRTGEADPINLNDPLMPGIPCDRLEEAIELSVESDEPGFFDKHDIDSSMILAGGVAIMLIIAALSRVLGVV